MKKRERLEGNPDFHLFAVSEWAWEWVSEGGQGEYLVKMVLVEEKERERERESGCVIDSLASPPFQSSLSLPRALFIRRPSSFFQQCSQYVGLSSCSSSLRESGPRQSVRRVGLGRIRGGRVGSRAVPMRVDGARFRIGRGRGSAAVSDVGTNGDETKMLPFSHQGMTQDSNHLPRRPLEPSPRSHFSDFE